MYSKKIKDIPKIYKIYQLINKIYIKTTNNLYNFYKYLTKPDPIQIEMYEIYPIR